MNVAMLKLAVAAIPDEYNEVEVIAQGDDEGNYYQSLSGVSLERGIQEGHRDWSFYEEDTDGQDEEWDDDEDSYKPVVVIW